MGFQRGGRSVSVLSSVGLALRFLWSHPSTLLPLLLLSATAGLFTLVPSTALFAFLAIVYFVFFVLCVLWFLVSIQQEHCTLDGINTCLPLLLRGVLCVAAGGIMLGLIIAITAVFASLFFPTVLQMLLTKGTSSFERLFTIGGFALVLAVCGSVFLSALLLTLRWVSLVQNTDIPLLQLLRKGLGILHLPTLWRWLGATILILLVPYLLVALLSAYQGFLDPTSLIAQSKMQFLFDSAIKSVPMVLALGVLTLSLQYGDEGDDEQ